jgi:hypothetical protein
MIGAYVSWPGIGCDVLCRCLTHSSQARQVSLMLGEGWSGVESARKKYPQRLLEAPEGFFCLRLTIIRGAELDHVFRSEIKVLPAA